MTVRIRPFEPQDRSAVRDIFKATAYHGESFSRFFDDGDWLADVMTTYYLEQEPASTFVADEDGTVVGYVTGALDTRRAHAAMKRLVFTRVIPGFFAGPAWRARSWRVLYHGLLGSLRGETAYPRWISEQYPAHVHLNLREGHRGHGTGRRLFEAFRARMERHGVTAVHARSSRADGGHPFFEALGFRPLLRRRLHVWDYLDSRPFELITYGLKWDAKNEPSVIPSPS